MRWLCVVLMSLMVVYGCSDMEDTWDRWFGNDDDDETTEVATAQPAAAEQPKAETEPKGVEPKPKVEPAPAPKTTKSSYSKKFHHYNPRAWHGKGVALVLCYGASRFDSCSINGEGMSLHGSRDKGRWVYSHYGDPGQSGTISCRKGRSIVKFKVRGGRSIQYGRCG